MTDPAPHARAFDLPGWPCPPRVRDIPHHQESWGWIYVSPSSLGSLVQDEMGYLWVDGAASPVFQLPNPAAGRWDPYAGRWALLGGHVDPGEKAVEAARRELLEETGVRVDGLDLVGVYGDPGRDPRGRYVTFAYMTSLPGPLPAPRAGDDAAVARWWPVGALTSGMMAFDHHTIIGDTLQLES